MNYLKILFDHSKRKLPVRFQIRIGFIVCLGITSIKCFHQKAAVVKMEILYKHIPALTGKWWGPTWKFWEGACERSQFSCLKCGSWSWNLSSEPYQIVFCSPHSPPKYLKLLYVSGNDHGIALWFDFCVSIVGCQQEVANAFLKWFCYSRCSGAVLWPSGLASSAEHFHFGEAIFVR